ncbi:YnfU family zinc-binding protein [Sodalis ligni]
MPTNIECPICHQSSKQDFNKISKDKVMICPHCHSYFLKNQKSPQKSDD